LKASFKEEEGETVEEDSSDYKIQDPKFVERNKRWIVIVDDEEAIRFSVGDYLYDQGYQVTACADADSLLEVCAKPRSEGALPAVPDTIVRFVANQRVSSCSLKVNTVHSIVIETN
jgi:hypothetical protein